MYMYILYVPSHLHEVSAHVHAFDMYSVHTNLHICILDVHVYMCAYVFVLAYVHIMHTSKYTYVRWYVHYTMYSAHTNLLCTCI